MRIYFGVTFLALGVFSSCDGQEGQSAFAGKSSKLKVNPAVRNPVGEGVPTDLDASLTSFRLSSPTRTSINGKEVWAVTHNNVYRIELDEDKAIPSYPMTQWTTAYNAGARTFVTEMGLIFGRSNLGAGTSAPGLYWASDQNPGRTIHVYQPPDQAEGSRFCVTSWRTNGQIYVGGAYHTPASERKFVRIPVSKNAQGQFSFGSPQTFTYGTGAWGYTCYTNQAKRHFWAGFSSTLHGIRLDDMASLHTGFIPNHAFGASSAIADFQVAPTEHGSYSINGDPDGNILSGKLKAGNGVNTNHESSYAWGFDPVSGFVLGSTWRQEKFYVTHPSCFSSDNACPKGQKHFVFTGMSNYGYMGPMSSLSDGRIAAWSRSSHHANGDLLSYLYFISLNDPKNPSAGLKIKKIREIPGETYMYTDFTGATLYPADVQKTLDLTQASGFRPGVPLTKLSLGWTADSSQAEAWTGLTLETRCYAKGAAVIPAFEAVAMPAAGAEVELPKCKDKVVDTVEVKIFGSGSAAAFSRTKSIDVAGSQQNPDDAAVAPTATPTPVATP